MKKGVFYTCMLAVFFLASEVFIFSPVYGAEVEVEGKAAVLGGNLAGARSQALRNALRNAV